MNHKTAQATVILGLVEEVSKQIGDTDFEDPGPNSREEAQWSVASALAHARAAVSELESLQAKL